VFLSQGRDVVVYSQGLLHPVVDWVERNGPARPLFAVFLIIVTFTS
jgi:hypothetical protein